MSPGPAWKSCWRITAISCVCEALQEWPKHHRYTARLRQLNREPTCSYETLRKGVENPDPAIAANVMIGLIKLTSYLLDQQIRHLEAAFLREGGLRERMTRARLERRRN